VQGSLTRRWGAWIAVWIQAAVFASAHYQYTMTAVQALVTVVSIFVIGLMLGVLRWRYGRLGPGMFAHACFNALAIILILALT
jgi:membrane protease YdiL (CAAX protease family)